MAILHLLLVFDDKQEVAALAPNSFQLPLHTLLPAAPTCCHNASLPFPEALFLFWWWLNWILLLQFIFSKIQFFLHCTLQLINFHWLHQGKFFRILKRNQRFMCSEDVCSFCQKSVFLYLRYGILYLPFTFDNFLQGTDMFFHQNCDFFDDFFIQISQLFDFLFDQHFGHLEWIVRKDSCMSEGLYHTLGDVFTLHCFEE